MSEIKKPEDIGSKLQSISNDVNAATLPKIASAYNVGKARDFSAKQANLAKYTTYDSETYGKLGFDPFKTSHTENKSGMDELYDTKTSWTADIGRAYTGMSKLAGIGIQDTIGLGAFADQGNYLTFEDTMNKYSSSRGGKTGFWANTMLSSGYTMGIIGGIAAEELALAGITAATGGMAAPGTVAAGGTLLARGIARIKETGNMLKAVNKLQDLNSAKGFLSATGKFVGGSVKGFAKALNPVENTFDFLKTIDKLEDFNGWRQAAIGAGAVVRDARKITMSHSESKLEADLAAKEFKQQMFDDFYLDKSNIGKEIPDSQLELINNEAQKVRDRVYASNFGLIYVTNAITFDNMFKGMRGTNRWTGVVNDAYRITKKEGGKVAVEAMAKTFGNAVRKKISTLTLKGSLKSAISSSMEGFQELGQDMISESMKSYHARNVKGTQVRGGFLEYLHNDLAKAAKKQQSEEGLTTFLSGALMGVFASPVGFATGQVNNFLAQGGIQKTYQRAFDNKTWKAEKLSLEVKRKEKAKVLTEFFNNNKNFIDGFSKTVYSQNELQEGIIDAAENNDSKTFKNLQHESFVTGVHTLLEAGLENEFADHLEYMAKNFGAQELNEVFGRTDITEENKSKYQQKLQDQSNNVKQLRAKYNEIQETINNPNSLKGAKVTDADYLDKYIKWRAVENLKKELLFSDSKIVDRANRLEAIKKDLNKENPLSSLEINSLLSEDALQQQIELLDTEVKANAEMKLSGIGLENSKKAKLKLDAYKAYQEKLKAFTQENQKEDGSIYESDAYEDLFEAYNNLMDVSGKNTLGNKQAQTEANKKQFDKVFDYISLGEENKMYQEFVDTLLNPSGASAFIQGQEEMLKRLDESKEDHIMNALQAFEEKSTADDMLNALYNEGLFFDLNELDDLLKNRMMPSEIYNLEDNNKPATPEQVRAAQDIINKFITRLTGKSIVNDKTVLNKQGRKLKSDKRTVAGILRQYNITLNKQIKLSSKQGQRLLDKMMAKENKYLTRLDREILAKLGDQDVTVKFITDGTLPIQMNEDGVLLLDLRFAGRDYTNSVMSFENMMVTALTQNKIAEQLREKDDLWLAARNAMEQAKVAFQKSFPTQNIDDVELFEDPVLFLTEAMNDIQFQKFLSQIEDNIQPASKSLWSTLMNGIEEIVEEDFDKKLVNRVINISAKALDDSIVENIAEEDTTSKESKEEKQKATAEKFDDLTTLAKELGQRWNVNVKVLASQEEANKILNDIQDPFFQADGQKAAGFYDEKTNTAYIVADAVQANTAYHEIFLHPFLINLEKTNPEFYKRLINEAKANAEAVAYVEKAYGPVEKIGVRQFEHELIGRVYDLNVNNQLDKTKNQGLLKTLGQFIKKMMTSVAEYFGIAKTDIKRFNEKKATIADLAKYAVRGTGKIDLGAIIEADNVSRGTSTAKPKTEPVGEVVEEELPEEVVDQPSRTEESYINEAEQIKGQIAKISAELDKLNKELADNSLSFVQKRSARKKITELSIELNDLYQQLNDIQPELDALKKDAKFEDTALEYEPRYDYNGNEIITHETPWPSVPKELRTALAALYEKPLTKINEEDVMAIREQMKSNPDYIALIAEYSDNRLREQDVVYGEKELEENRKKVEAAKEARRKQIQTEKEQNRLDKKQRRQLKAPIVNENYLKNLLKDYDYSILTDKEIDMLVEKMRNKTSMIPFTVNDVISYISNKKAEAQKKLQRRKLIDDIEKMREQKKIDAQIKDNYEYLQKRKLKFKNNLEKVVTIIVPNNGMVKFIATYHPEIFKLDRLDFLEEVKFILDQRKADLVALKKNGISFKPKGINFQLVALVKQLEKDKKLYPDTVYQINLALYKAGSNLRIKAFKSTKGNILSSMYTIGKKSAGEKRIAVSKGKYTNLRDLIQQSEFKYSEDLNNELAIVKYFILGNKVRPDALFDIYDALSTEAKSWMGIVSKDANKATKSFDGAGEYILQSWDGLNVDLGANAFEEFLKNYSNLKDAIFQIGNRLLNAQKENLEIQEDEEDETDYSGELFIQNAIEQGMTQSEAVSSLITLQFLNTPEGQEILDEEAAALSAYMDSVQAEIINGEYEGDPNELNDEDLELFNDNEDEEFNPENAELANDLANAEIELPEEMGTPVQETVLSEIEQKYTDLINESSPYFNIETYLGKVWDSLNKENLGNLVYAIAAYKLTTSKELNLGLNKIGAIETILNNQFRTGVFNDKFVNIENKPFRVAGYQQKQIVLQDMQTLEYKPMLLADFIASVKEVLKSDSEFNATNIDSVVNVEEFPYIKESFNDILNNFTSYMQEANSLSEEDLMVDLNKELTKCK